MRDRLYFWSLAFLFASIIGRYVLPVLEAGRWYILAKGRDWAVDANEARRALKRDVLEEKSGMRR